MRAARGEIVAFNNVGFFTIDAGKTMHLAGWFFPGNQDMGAQFFAANPIFPLGSRDFAEGPLISFDQGESLASADEGGPGPVFGHGRTYEFKVRNEASDSMAFNVHGGGYV